MGKRFVNVRNIMSESKDAIPKLIILILGLWLAIPSEIGINTLILEGLREVYPCQVITLVILGCRLLGVLIVVSDVLLVVKQFWITNSALTSVYGSVAALISGLCVRNPAFIGAWHTWYGFPLAWFEKVVIVYPTEPTSYSFLPESFVLDIVFWSIAIWVSITVVSKLLKARRQNGLLSEENG